MYNWNTDTTKFPTAEAKKIWEITQRLDYGVHGQKIQQSEIMKYLQKIKNQIDPAMKRLLEYTLSRTSAKRCCCVEVRILCPIMCILADVSLLDRFDFLFLASTS